MSKVNTHPLRAKEFTHSNNFSSELLSNNSNSLSMHWQYTRTVKTALQEFACICKTQICTIVTKVDDAFTNCNCLLVWVSPDKFVNLHLNWLSRYAQQHSHSRLFLKIYKTWEPFTTANPDIGFCPDQHFRRITKSQPLSHKPLVVFRSTVQCLV